MKHYLTILLFFISFLVTAQTPQIRVAAPLTTFGGTYPTHYDSLGRGGYMSVANITARNTITAERRKEGMLVFVKADSSLYILRGGILNTNWLAFNEYLELETGGGTTDTSHLRSDIEALKTGKQNTISLGTTSQYFRGNLSLATLDKTAVGLNLVDNTTDASKPISTSTQTALNLKLNISDTATLASGDGTTLVGSGTVPDPHRFDLGGYFYKDLHIWSEPASAEDLDYKYTLTLGGKNLNLSARDNLSVYSAFGDIIFHSAQDMDYNGHKIKYHALDTLLFDSEAATIFRAKQKIDFRIYEGSNYKGVDLNTNGTMDYQHNYASDYTLRSHVDKNYVDSSITVAIAGVGGSFREMFVNIAALQAYTGDAQYAFVRDLVDGGSFYRDPTNPAAVDGYIYKDALNRSWRNEDETFVFNISATGDLTKSHIIVTYNEEDSTFARRPADALGFLEEDQTWSGVNAFTVAPKLSSSSTTGYVWTAIGTDGTGAWAAPSGGGGGSGAVNSGAANRLAYYTAAGTTVDDLAAITASRVLISDANGLPTHSSVTSTTLGYLDISSSLTTLLSGKEGTLTKGNLTETTSSVLTITGGTGSVIGSGTSIQVKVANTSQSGYLSSTDWNTFNGKQATNANLTSIAALTDPNADRIAFWDDSDNAWKWLTLGSNLSISGTTLNASGSGGSSTLSGLTDVTLTSAANGDGLYFNGTVWENAPAANVDLTGIANGDLVRYNSSEGNFEAFTPTYLTSISNGSITNAMLAGSIANSKLVNSTISGIALGSSLATLTFGTDLTGTSYNGGTAATIGLGSNVATLSGTQTFSGAKSFSTAPKLTTSSTSGYVWTASGTDGSGGWAPASGGGGGDVASVFGRTGAVVAATDDYTWAQINKSTSSIADIATRSAGDLNSGTLADGRLSSNVPLLNAANSFTAINTFRNATNSASVQAAIFEGDAATNADDDEAYISFKLSNDGGTQTELGRLTWIATDVNSATSVDGELGFSVMTAGSLAAELQLNGSALFPSTNGGLNLGTSSLRFEDLHLNDDIIFQNGDVTLAFSSDRFEINGAGNGIGIGSTLYSVTANSAALGTTTNPFSALMLGSGGIINFNNGDVTFTHGSNVLTLAGGNLALGSNSLTMTGSIAATGNRVTKGWFTDIESTNAPTVSGSPVYYIGGTDVGVADGGTNISSYAVGDLLYASGTTTLSKLAGVATGNVLISGGVTTAPSWAKVGLTTHVTGSLPDANIESASTWNAKQNALSGTGYLKFSGTTPSYSANVPWGDLSGANAGVLGSTLTGYTSGSGTISSSDNILQAIQKLNGNIGALSASVPILVSGSYTPDFETSNITSATPSNWRYIRVGDIVTVTGRINVQTSGTAPMIRFNVPPDTYSGSFTESKITGVVTSADDAVFTNPYITTGVNPNPEIKWTSANNSVSRFIYFTFSYTANLNPPS